MRDDLAALAVRLREKGLSVRENADGAALTTFRTGGPVRLLIETGDREEMLTALRLTSGQEKPRRILGNGSNVLIGGGGFSGIVIRAVPGEAELTRDAEGYGILGAFAGTLLSRAANLALEKGFSGMEALSGIPGSVGGAVYMNAGAYGQTVADVLAESLSFDGENAVWLPVEAHGFGYRESIYKEEPERAVLYARFRLEPGDPAKIRQEMQEYALRRRTSQPLEFPSAGSVFKRPAGYFAGKLIEDAGLKGLRIGGAEVSPKHAGFIVNAGGASPEDVLKLVRAVQKSVYRKDGVRLEPEVEFLGDFLYEEELPWNS